jgi:hypothetical protein
MNQRLGILGALIVSILGWVVPALPAQDGLYAPSVPSDAALVRVANLHGTDASPRLDMGPVRFAPVGAGEVTPYRPTPPGIYIIGGRASGVEFFPEPGGFYSIVVDPAGELVVVRDEAHRDPARAQIVLFNFSGETVDLASIEPPAAIFGSVPSGSARSVAVNAIAVDLAVEAGGEELLRQRVQLERGDSYGIFVAPGQVFIEAASVATD